MLVAGALLVAGLPDYGRFVGDEDTPVTWLQSVLLVVVAVLGAAVAARRWLAGGRLWPWIALAPGFAWLAVDERFVIHERLRDEVLAERLPKLLPWGEAGDVVLLVYAVGGVFVAWAVLRELRGDRLAAAAFVAGLVLLGTAVAADTVDPDSLSPSVELAEQVGEELFELMGETLLVLALGLTLLAPTGRVPAGPPTGARSRP